MLADMSKIDRTTIWMKLRQALAILRTSSHRLEIGIGRLARTEINPFENRKCKHCQKLEDELHFILECPLYSNI